MGYFLCIYVLKESFNEMVYELIDLYNVTMLLKEGCNEKIMSSLISSLIRL